MLVVQNDHMLEMEDDGVALGDNLGAAVASSETSTDSTTSTSSSSSTSSSKTSRDEPSPCQDKQQTQTRSRNAKRKASSAHPTGGNSADDVDHAGSFYGMTGDDDQGNADHPDDPCSCYMFFFVI